ncbi:DUF6377 domain-containing protein [Pseudopedobacter sp.]|uniref:DUF6377 domain-containing protein n=1 Tax=Pseudopedobacter sp. TaxID=1936787 RepID=UPI003340EB6A
MKALTFLITLFLSSSIAVAQTDSLSAVLYSLIQNKEPFIEKKERDISEIKKMLEVPDLSKRQQYDINRKLFEEYKTYISDSAIHYAQNNLKIAYELNDSYAISETKLILASAYSIAGMFIESLDLLKSIEKRNLTYELKVSYYDNYKLLYGYYAQNNFYTSGYNKRSAIYRDSLLGLLDTNFTHYKIVYADKLYDNNQLKDAKEILTNLLNQSKEENHERAILAYALANVYKKEGNIEMQKKYFTLSAICDIKNNIKENASLQALALVLYEMGDIENAYQCIKSSMEDAIFCNARLRTFEVSKIFPIIDSAYQEKTLKQREELKRFLLLISILSVFLVIALIFVYRQMKKVARIRKKLHLSNLKLNEVNRNLQEANDKLKATNLKFTELNTELSEANQIKEAYIGHFLDLCSTYIDKLQKFQNSINRKLTENKREELLKILRSNEMIDNELKELYDNFDHIFLHLYPNFVEDFNSLLLEEERFVLKHNELLNVELRIFALIRLGITDSSKIAAFLHYSANTIYSYRTRVRNKAAVPRHEFESLVMKIGSISQ